MLQKCRKMLRNEKGLTLIELLAVVVILGIIAAIAVPSIGKIIDNSKKDAHLANAQQMVSAGKLAIVNNADIIDEDTNQITLGALQGAGLIESNIKHPHGDAYDIDNSYVVVSGTTVTGVLLLSKDTAHGVYSGSAGSETVVSVTSLSRSSVKPE